jgi:hypothetical protein
VHSDLVAQAKLGHDQTLTALWSETALSSSACRPVVMKTYAPSFTKRSAVASPIPLLPPVMTSTLPSCARPSLVSLERPYPVYKWNIHYRYVVRRAGSTILYSNFLEPNV